MRPARSHTGYGVFDLNRQVARRVRRAWEMVENPTRPWNAGPHVLPAPQPESLHRRPVGESAPRAPLAARAA